MDAPSRGALSGKARHGADEATGGSKFGLSGQGKVVVPSSRSTLARWLMVPGRSGAELAAAVGRFQETDRVIAVHASAPAGVLSKLSHSSDRVTRAKVAGNPNTPQADYVRLGQQFPKEFLANPILDVLLLEAPALFRHLPESLLVRLLKRETCPPEFLVWAAALSSEKVQLSVAMNVRAPMAALERLRTSPYEKVRNSLPEAIAERTEADAEAQFRDAVSERLGNLTETQAQEAWRYRDIGLAQFNELSSAARDAVSGWTKKQPKSSTLATALASNPALPVHSLEVLANEIDGVRSEVAANPNTPVPLLEALAMDKDKQVRAAVASNPNTPASVLKALAKQENLYGDDSVRWSVAENPSTPIQVLKALAKDGFTIAVASNPNTPVLLLEALAKNKDKQVLRAVAANPKTPIPLLKALAKNKDEWVRDAVASNPNTPASLLESLARGGYEISVAANPNTQESLRTSLLEAMANDESGRTCEVAGNPRAPLHLLETLARHEDMRVCQAVAGNPGTPSQLLEALAKHKGAKVRQGVAGNTNTPVHVLEALAKRTKDKHVLCNLAKNPNTPAPLLEALWNEEKITLREGRSQQARDKYEVSWRKKMLEKVSPEIRAAVERGDFLVYCGSNPHKAVLAKRPLAALMALMAGPQVTPDRIARAVNSTDWLVRAAVARNRGTPENLRTKLTQDRHPLVRALANSSRDSTATPVTARAAGGTGYDLVRVSAELSALMFKKHHVFLPLFVDGSLDERTAVRLIGALPRKNTEKLRTYIAGNANTPVTLLEMLAKDKGKDVLRAVAGNPNTPATLRESLLEVLAKDQDSSVRKAVAENPYTPVYLLEALAKDQDVFVRIELAHSPNTPVHLLGELAKHFEGLGFDLVRHAVARNPNTPVPLLEALAKDKVEYVRWAVAGNPNTPATLRDSQLRVLAKEKAYEARKAVAKNPCTPVFLLRSLAKDRDKWIREEVTHNPNTPATLGDSLLAMLAEDNDRSVRKAVANNPKTPVPLLKVLAKDKDKLVRKAVANNPNTPATLRHSLLEVLAKAKDSSVRGAVAENPNTAAPLLEALAKDKDSSVRGAVARNPNTPVPLLEALARDKVYHVRRAVARNRMSVDDFGKTVLDAADTVGMAPDYVYERLYQRSLQPGHMKQYQQEAVLLSGINGTPSLPEKSVLRWLVRLTDLPTARDNKSLTGASRDINWLVRLGAALHPDATDAMLTLLSNDLNADVAGAAHASLRARNKVSAASPPCFSGRRKRSKVGPSL